MRPDTVAVAHVNDGSLHEQMVRVATVQLLAGHLPLAAHVQLSLTGCRRCWPGSRSKQHNAIYRRGLAPLMLPSSKGIDQWLGG